MASLNRNINLECSICKKKMSSDHLKGHWIAKLKNFDFKVTTIVLHLDILCLFYYIIFRLQYASGLVA